MDALATLAVALRTRLTPRRRVALLGLAAWPPTALLLLLLGVATGFAELAARIVLVVSAVVVIGCLALVRRWRRRRRPATGEYAFTGSLEGVARGSRSDLAAGPIGASAVVGWELADAPTSGLTAFALSTGSRSALDALALAATGRRFDFRSLVDALAADPSADLLGPIDARLLATLTRVATSRSTAASGGAVDPALASAATVLARAAAQHRHRNALSAEEHRSVASQLLLAGERERAARLLAERRSVAAPDWLLSLDAIDREAPGGLDAWLASLNAFYRRGGLEPVLLDRSAPVPFDGLVSEADAAVEDGPLVSVIMTTFRPGREAVVAARSVLGQSWRRWELLVMDDASGEDFDGVLAEIAGLDPRIRVVRADRNDGTYVRRNDALALASGEFVTMHDSDDWAHPRRLEAQVRHLQAEPLVLGNLVRSLRATPDLRFAQPRGAMLRLTEASILFRRDRARELVGGFDTVRKAGDTGFRLRLEAVQGRPLPIVAPDVPLMIVRYEPTSLSGADLGDGWMSPARVAYSSAHAHWLSQSARRGAPPVLPVAPAERPFPAPAALVGTTAPPLTVDALIVLDVRADPDRAAADARVDQVLADASRSRRIAVMRGERPASRPLPHTARTALQQLINDGRVVEVLPGDDVRAELLVVPDELALLGLPPSIRGPLAQRAAVVSPPRDGTPGSSLTGSEALRRCATALVAGEVERLTASGLLSAIVRP